ncbi:MAG: VWA domain-containing protein, partial [Candidatus Bathyarchaeota archaeon]|nr:VWA domain-containing protein [Candidatus Bathyarchaeota archaeon]
VVDIKMKAISLKTAFLIIFLLTSVAAAYPSDVKAAGIIQVGMALDGSTSITSSDWTIILDGVASALENNVPHDGTVELTVVQFSSGLSETHGSFSFKAKTEVAPTVITAGNFASVATAIQNIVQGKGSTPMADGVWVAWLDMSGSQNFQTASKQVINIATDGVPNQRWSDTNLRTPAGTSPSDVTDARNAAVTAGLEELDAEGIGSGVDVNYLRDSVVWPQPGTIAPPFNAGWVQQVADAASFKSAIGHKFEIISAPRATLPVAGVVMSVDKFGILGPYLALLGLMAVLSTVIMVKKRRD